MELNQLLYRTDLIIIRIRIRIIMAEMAVILHGLATSNEGDAYYL